jgi:hypothetical protein
MTSQQLGDLALEEHRAVMAALIKNEISRPTEDQYEAVLDALRSTLSCVSTSLESPERLSSAF